MLADYSFASLFATHEAVLLHYRYAILFAVALVEGTGTMIATGALIAAGVFDATTAFLVCVLAEVCDGFMWYSVGYFFGAKPIAYFTKKSEARKAFLAAIKKHTDRAAGLVVLAVKLTYSITTPTLILIGSLHYDIRRYAFFNTIGSIGWVTMLLSLGYASGHTAIRYLSELRTVGVIVFILICALALLVALREFGDTVMKRIT